MGEVGGRTYGVWVLTLPFWRCVVVRLEVCGLR